MYQTKNDKLEQELQALLEEVRRKPAKGKDILNRTRADMNKRVKKGGDIGIVPYTRSYFLILFTLLPFMFVAISWGNMLDTSDPLTGVLYTGVVIFAFIKLIKWYDRG